MGYPFFRRTYVAFAASDFLPDLDDRGSEAARCLSSDLRLGESSFAISWTQRTITSTICFVVRSVIALPLRFAATAKRRAREAAARHCCNRWTWLRPAHVVSKAKFSRARTSICRRSIMSLPAERALPSGFNGERPRAISSAFTNSRTPSFGSKRKAMVVLPAPLGPPSITTFFAGPWVVCSICRSELNSAQHHAARSATTASSTGNPSGVTRSRPAESITISPCSRSAAMRSGSSGRPANTA